VELKCRSKPEEAAEGLGEMTAPLVVFWWDNQNRQWDIDLGCLTETAATKMKFNTFSIGIIATLWPWHFQSCFKPHSTSIKGSFLITLYLDVWIIVSVWSG
jgi:hypothetical protein